MIVLRFADAAKRGSRSRASVRDGVSEPRSRTPSTSPARSAEKRVAAFGMLTSRMYSLFAGVP